jgi:hypothetical protein
VKKLMLSALKSTALHGVKWHFSALTFEPRCFSALTFDACQQSAPEMKEELHQTALTSQMSKKINSLFLMKFVKNKVTYEHISRVL